MHYALHYIKTAHNLLQNAHNTIYTYNTVYNKVYNSSVEARQHRKKQPRIPLIRSIGSVGDGITHASVLAAVSVPK